MIQVKKLKVSAPGKLILSGEHAVVYGYPALVSAVNRRLEIDENYNITSQIPIGCGMGSSAAYSVACAAMNILLQGKPLNKEQINEIAYEKERSFHARPSGVDNTIVTYGGLLWYRKETESLKTFNQIKVAGKLPSLWLCNTGKPVETTGEMVEQVRLLYKRQPKNTDKILREIETVTRRFGHYLTSNDTLPLEEIIRENERLLEKLGVVSEITKTLIRKLEKHGAVAKISGAGGRKDASGVVIVYHQEADKVKRLLTQEKLDFFEICLGEEGVRCE